MKKIVKTVSAIIFVLLVLVFAFFMQNDTPVNQANEEITVLEEYKPDRKTEAQEVLLKETTQNKDEKVKTDDLASDVDLTQNTNESIIINNDNDENIYCSISVRCDTILNNIDLLKKEKANIIPENGLIYNCDKAVFYEGESAFNVLSRELKKNKIHFEFNFTPIYNTAYIEGIGNIYELDCGDLSGWMYKVNGALPNVGCSQYILKNGDKIEFIYSCNMGNDIK